MSILLFAFLAWDFMGEYISMHEYYLRMLEQGTNIRVVLAGLVLWAIPGAYLLFVKKKQFLHFFWVMLFSLFLFMAVSLSVKGGLLWGPLKLFINVVLTFGLWVAMIIGFLAIGDWLRTRVLRLSTSNLFDVLLNLGFGLGAFLLYNYFFLIFGLYHPLINWLVLVGVWCLAWWRRSSLEISWRIFTHAFDEFSQSKRGWTRWVVLLLLAFTCMYLFNGFSLAFIPYPTAWDANHAYMFYPKMWALNGGYDWLAESIRTIPHLWYGFIAYWFSLFLPLGSVLMISPDTFAIQMNFWSGLLVLFFGLGVTSEVLAFIRERSDKLLSTSLEQSIFGVGWLYWLLWLSSGMGAFLVFVDNKTDLGVFALTLLAVYSGFVFIRALYGSGGRWDRVWLISILSSWVFFALAVAAKPTALFEVVNFGLFMWFIWLGFIGVVGVVLLIMWLLALLEFRWIRDYIPAALGNQLAYIGGALFGLGGVYAAWKRAWRYLQVVLLWLWAFVVSLLVIKVPYEVAYKVMVDDDLSTRQIVERIFLSSTHTEEGDTASPSSLPASLQKNLYAQADNEPNPVVAACTLESLGLQSADELYDELLEMRGDQYSEDVWRYVWFGWKWWTTDRGRWIDPFLDPWRGFLFSEWCSLISPFAPFDTTAVVLCETEELWRSDDVEDVISVREQVVDGHLVAGFLDELIDLSDRELTGGLVGQRNDLVAALDNYMQDYSVRVEVVDGVQRIYFPYKFLNVFNISFNWSLQNLSSYYTDIGIVWLLGIIFVIVALVYAILARLPILSALSTVTLFGWLLRWLIGGGILWYAIGIIWWTIITFIAFVRYLADDAQKITRWLTWLFLAVIVVIGLWQLALNFTRIASQGWQGAFLWYKSNVGIREHYDTQLRRTTPVVSNFRSEDIFNLQFPHYHTIIDLAHERWSEDGMLIAGTYLWYFLDHQRYIKQDGFLWWLSQMVSDSDPCATYLRLRDNNMRYLVIDPNIGTVVQWWWNQTLFDRFFARLDTTDGSILQHGAISMLAKLAQEWYIRLVSTNNIGSYYAFSLSEQYFGDMSADQQVMTRARMAIPRFWWANNVHITNIEETAVSRIGNGLFINELAQVMGKQVRADLLQELVMSSNVREQDVEALTQDERAVLAQFIGLVQLANSQPDQLRNQLRNLINQSIQSGSQIIVLEIL